ncbi:MAG: CopG family transcriptional regulator [Cyanobacteriota bacterium]|nr:CopG family transcriptional regulator [Cyanobacteriota bacterium]
MRTTLEIDDHLLDAVRELARSQRCTNGEVVGQLLRQALLGEQPAPWASASGRLIDAPLTTNAAVNRIRQQVSGQ